MFKSILITLKVLTLAISLSSCVETQTKKVSSSSDNLNNSNNNNNNSNNNNNNSGGGNSGSGTIDRSCYARGVGDQVEEYYRVPAIFKGRGGIGKNWSTDQSSIFSGDKRDKLRTDRRFNVRVVVKPSPGGGPSAGACPNMAVNYTKLSFTLDLKASSNSSPFQSMSFRNVAIDQCTEVFEFLVPTTSNPLVLDVRNIKWDFCVNGPGTCPEDFVWRNDCVELEVQIATDLTKDIPH